ncbi:MAG: hypothetical protein IAF58_07500 [Leptolyngbya sp.]|nr:hypothetical protein [Candidatus Melainabacteria bacterium]
MARFKISKLAFISIAIITMVSPAMAASEAEDEKVFSSVMIEATPKAVLDAIRLQRQVDPARRLVSTSGAESMIDENFSGLPVIGSAKCLYKEVESENSVEYYLISSDKFKRFEGRWTLTSQDGGRKTQLRLSSQLDTGMKIPFAKQITNCAVKKDVLRRLGRVKNLAEATTVVVPLKHLKASN